MVIDRFFRTCLTLLVCLVVLFSAQLRAAEVSVSQSSTAYSGLAERAYDQNVDSVYRNRSISHTRNEKQPWWTLDLGQSTAIEAVTLHNRTDCCSNRLSDFYVLVSESPFGSRSLSALLKNKSIERVHVPGQAADIETLSFNASGRYVRVQLAGTNPLSLAEVEITTAPSVPLKSGPDLPVQIKPPPLTSIEQGERISFVWGLDPSVDSYDFHIYNRTEPTRFFNSLTDLQPDEVCVEDLCSVQVSLDIPVYKFHSWRVRARRDGEVSGWVQTFFNVVDTSPDTGPPATPEAPDPPQPPPVVIAPLASTPVRTGEIAVFEWQAVTDAVSYDLAITNGDSGAVETSEALLPADICNASTCSFSQVVDLTVGTNHDWQLRARYNDQISDWVVTPLNVSGEPEAEPPVVDPPEVDPPEVDPPVVEPPEVDPPEAEPPVVEPPEVDPPEVDPPEAEPPVVEPPEVDPPEVDPPVGNPSTTVSANDASRFLTQASFGPTRESILEVQSLGIEQWIDKQFTLQGAPHLDYVRQYSNGSSRGARHEVWWSDVVLGEDQLRQRVAFALSQLFVISDTGYTLANSQYGITGYYDLLRENAFGNYRDLLEDITLSPVMGLYLSLLQNAKEDDALSTRPDENYAREVLQLFSIGLYKLDIDGTTDGTPVFTQNQIEDFARVFTGWNYADAGRWSRKLFTGAEMIDDLRPMESFHDNGSKNLLNDSMVGGLTAREDLEFALDNIFNHANVGPFISKKLIKQLVTSNPSAAYVRRVATVFNSDSSGERGNLQSVIKAILLDSEARSIPQTNYYGKLREPVLRFSHLWRAFNFNVSPAASNAQIQFNLRSPELMNLDLVTGQAVLKSPSVFNFFESDYSPAGPVADYSSVKLVAPEFEIFTESNELATSNRIGDQIQRSSYMGGSDGGTQPVSYLDFSYERTLAESPQALLDHLDTLLLSGNMSDGLREILLDHLSALPDSDSGLDQRVRDAVILIMASPDYLIQM